jgi:hypothetical protein
MDDAYGPDSEHGPWELIRARLGSADVQANLCYATPFCFPLFTTGSTRHALSIKASYVRLGFPKWFIKTN